jgi:TolB-like protein
MDKHQLELSQSAIQKQLQLLLNSDGIRNSQVLTKFLEFVVSEKLAGHDDEIKEYTIGVRALGRPSDFNPQLDAIVRIHAGRLRRAITQYYYSEGKNDPVIIHIPKGTYIPGFSINNAEPNSFSADLSKTEHAEHSSENGNNKHATKPVLAVLPFRNLSAENSRDNFIDGIGEQLASDLAKFNHISIISYYSTHNYDPAFAELKEMKKSMDIDYVLTGTVRFISDKLRLNVQLITTENGAAIWTETYVHHLTRDIFDIQEEITNQVMNIIADEHGIINRIGKKYNLHGNDASNAVVQAATNLYHKYSINFDPALFEPTLQSLELALNTDPENSQINAMISDMTMDIYLYKPKQDPEILNKALRHARIAVGNDEYSQHAHKVLGWALLLSGKKENSIEVMQHCIHMNPKSANFLSVIGLGFICIGEYEKGFNCLNQSLQLNNNAPTTSKLGFALYYFHQRNYSESLKWLERAALIEFPFISLLNLAIIGKINKDKNSEMRKNVLSFKENAMSLVSRFIFDIKLKTEIFHGMKLAGVQIA